LPAPSLTGLRINLFFLYASYRAPHVPLDAPQKYLDRFPGEMPERRRQALAMISCVDDGVGQMVETLRKNGLEEDTLIFVIADNGAPYKIHKTDMPGGGPGWDGSLNDPMNGEKGMLTEGGVRVPFVVSWKGTIPGGQVVDHPVITLDVAATAVAQAGLPEDPALDGVNLIPYLTGEKQGAPHEALYWRWLGQSTIRKGKWKYLRADDREYLFDMENDFIETKNLVEQYPEVAATLHADLGKWCNTLNPPGIWAQKSGGMSKTADEYYNWYVDGNHDLPTPMADAKSGLTKKAAPAKQTAKAPEMKKGPPDAAVFKKWDADQNGEVTFEEYIVGREHNKGVLKKNFDKRDANGNGIWEKAEIK
jgi:uncharacterized sulfatase